MNHRIILTIIFIISLVGFLVATLSTESSLQESGVCNWKSIQEGYSWYIWQNCHAKVKAIVLEPVQKMLLPLAIVAALLLFFSDKIFKLWAKFTIIYYFVVFALLRIAPPACLGSFLGLGGSCGTRSEAATIYGWLYLIVTAGIAIIKTIQARRKLSVASASKDK